MNPGVSIIVPMFNAQDTIVRCIESLLAQDYQGKYEILVIDNVSTDASLSLVPQNPRVRVLIEQNLGPASARNRGIEHARYRLIAFTDSDCLADVSWLTNLVDGLDNEFAGIGGAILNGSSGAISEFVEEISFKQEDLVSGPLSYLATANALFRLSAIEQIGGFDESFPIAGGEDNDLGWRLKQCGHNLQYTRNAIVYHLHPTSHLDFALQRLRYGFGTTLLQKKYPSLDERKNKKTKLQAFTEVMDVLLRNLVNWAKFRDHHSALFFLSELAFGLGMFLGMIRRFSWCSEVEEKESRTTQPMCLKPWTSFEVDDPTGNVTPCCWSKRHVGNINKDSVKTIWNGQLFKDFREEMLAGNYDSICRSDCPYRRGTMRECIPKRKFNNKFDANISKLEHSIQNVQTHVDAEPISIRIVPSIRCNLDCIMCWQRTEVHANIPSNFYDYLRSRLSTLSRLVIQGGEPLMIRECVDLISTSRKEEFTNLRIELMTNGLFIDERFLKKIQDSVLSALFISLDAASAETYRTIRGGCFETAKQAIALVRNYRPDVDITLGFVVMQENVSEMVEFAQMANSLGCDFEFSPIIAAYKKDDDFLDHRFLEQLEESIADFDEYVSQSGLRNKSISTVKHKLWSAKLMASRSSNNSQQQPMQLYTLDARKNAP